VEEYLINNATTQSCEIDLYDVVLKRDMLVNLTFSANGISYTAPGFPAEYINVGLQAQQGVNPSSPPNPLPYNIVSCVPTDSQLFKQYFKIVKKTRVFMAPGACHKHTFTIKTNRMLDEYLVSGGYQGIKGFTSWTMMVIRGMPVYDAETATVTSTTASTAIQCVRSQRIKYSYIADTSYTSLFGSSLTNIPAANQSFVSPLNGTVVYVEGAPPIS
jgi:hypothetical protein